MLLLLLLLPLPLPLPLLLPLPLTVSLPLPLPPGKNYLERAVQKLLYPPELFCDRPQLQEPPRAPVLNLGTPVYKPRRDAAVAAGLRVQEIAQHEQNQ